MKALQLTQDALATLRALPLTLMDEIALPDAEAAERLNQRLALLDMIEAAHGISYSQRLVIIAEFRRRSLWKYLIDPMVGESFPHETAWLSSGFVGCRRVNFEAKRDGDKLIDVPASKLIDMAKSSIKVLTGVSTAVRNLPDVLEAAKAGEDALRQKLEKDHPGQHIEEQKRYILRPGRSQMKVYEEWVEYAIGKGLAATKEEAIEQACAQALHDAELDEELAAMPAAEEETV